MSAFSDSGRQRLKEPLVGFYRLIAHSRPWPLQDDKELERLLIKNEHRDLLRRAADICGKEVTTKGSLSARYYFNDEERVIVGFTPSSGLTMLLPDYAAKNIEDSADADTFCKVAEYINWRREIAETFTLMWTMIQELDRTCVNKREVRFFFPGILALLTDELDKQTRANLLHPYSPRNIPKIHPDMAAFARHCTQMIAKAALLDPKTSGPRGGVAIHIAPTRETKYVATTHATWTTNRGLNWSFDANAW